jgi:hypothetical protein
MAHPDAPGGSAEAFAELNTAWQTLRDPAGCLRHYLELGHPELLAATQNTPSELVDIFMEIAATRQRVQVFAEKCTKAASPISRALLEPERLAIAGQITSLQEVIASRTGAASATIRKDDVSPNQLATLLSTLVFLGKWEAQLRESALAIAPTQTFHSVGH